jgi:hypothetical protein
MAIMKKSWASAQMWFTKVLKNILQNYIKASFAKVDLHFDEPKMDYLVSSYMKPLVVIESK